MVYTRETSQLAEQRESEMNFEVHTPSLLAVTDHLLSGERKSHSVQLDRPVDHCRVRNGHVVEVQAAIRCLRRAGGGGCQKPTSERDMMQMWGVAAVP